MHIFILGHSNDPNGTLSAVSLTRVSLAVSTFEEFQRRAQSPVIMATGGFGDRFNASSTPHHIWVERELDQLGLSAGVRSGEALRSANTVEDAILIRKYAQTHAIKAMVVITSEFHAARCRIIFDAVFDAAFVPILAAPDPPLLESRWLAHEKTAIEHLRQQGGVLWNGVTYPLAEHRR